MTSVSSGEEEQDFVDMTVEQIKMELAPCSILASWHNFIGTEGTWNQRSVELVQQKVNISLLVAQLETTWVCVML